MSFLAIHETQHADYVDIEFIEAMECIHLQDFSFKPIKELPAGEVEESRKEDILVEIGKENIMPRSLLSRPWSPSNTTSKMFSFKPIKELYQSLESECVLKSVCRR